MSGVGLLAAIESESIANVTAELDNGAPVDFIGEMGTPLQMAVAHNNIPIINLLLARGATVDLQNQSGETALGIAILNLRPSIVQRLLDVGANANHRDGEGYTLLHLAASGGSLSIVEKLLQAGATVDAMKEVPGNNNNNNNQNNQNNDEEEDEEKGNTALFFAAMNGRLPIVQRLLAAGADRHHENESGETVEDVATPEVLAHLQQLQQGGRRSRKATRRRSTRRRSTRRRSTHRRTTRRRSTRRRSTRRH